MVFLKILQTFYRKAPVLESLFIKLQAEGLQLYLKETPTQVFSCEILRNF